MQQIFAKNSFFKFAPECWSTDKTPYLPYLNKYKRVQPNSTNSEQADRLIKKKFIVKLMGSLHLIKSRHWYYWFTYIENNEKAITQIRYKFCFQNLTLASCLLSEMKNIYQSNHITWRKRSKHWHSMLTPTLSHPLFMYIVLLWTSTKLQGNLFILWSVQY